MTIPSFDVFNGVITILVIMKSYLYFFQNKLDPALSEEEEDIDSYINPPLTTEEKDCNEEFARKSGQTPLIYNYVRPLNAPNTSDVCPVCLEDLFDENGDAEKPVGKIMCLHLVHSDCLQAAGRALNATGDRYGVGGMGLRSGCPVCETAVSFWMMSNRAVDFPVFWMHRIQACLEKIGSRGGPISVERVKEMLEQDGSLTSDQKQVLRENSEDSGFNEALCKGGCRFVNLVVDGGVARNGGIKTGSMPGIWKYDRTEQTLFLGKWE